MGRHIALGAAVLGLAAGTLNAQIAPKVGKQGLEATLVDSNMAPITDGVPRVNFMRTPPDGSGRRFLVDTEGELYVYATDGSQTLYTDFQAIYPDLLNSDRHQGFTALAFHPDFATNGLFYTVHTEKRDAAGPDHAPLYHTPAILDGATQISRASQNVLVEWHALDPAANVFAGTRREVMRVETVGIWHGMGEIQFNPLAQPGDDDYALLYITMGDGESYFNGYGGNDPNKTNNLQRLDSYLGTMMRIDPLGNDGPTGLYGIPAINPWANDGDPDTFGELVAYGFRNPHRFSWDPVSGEMFIFDIGEARVEEISVFEPGGNYGWPVREGAFNVGGTALPPDILDGTTQDGFTYPVVQFDHTDGKAIAGGVPCRDCGVPALEGKMLLGDIPSGKVFVADIAAMLADDDGVPGTWVLPEELQLIYQGQRVEPLEVVQLAVPAATRVDLRFNLDENGTVYVFNKADGVARYLQPAPCRADTTTTNTNPGDTGYAQPDGEVNGADLSHYVEMWIGADLAADVTTDSTNPGQNGYGVPDGVLSGADISWYVECWLGGCL